MQASQRAFVGQPVAARRVQPFSAARGVVVVRAAAEPAERLRLHNLSPQKGSRRDEKRKGRGYGGHQGGTCGFGTRGQKARSGSGTRPGFEGGQMPLYRRLPKLRGIAGGMSAGLPKYVVVNLDDLDKAFEAGSEVTLDAIQSKGLLNISGRDTKLGLKVLGSGSLSKALTIKADAFSASASEKIGAAGGSAEAAAAKIKWTRRAHEKRVKELVAAGLDPKKEAAKAKAARAAAKKK
ncbi:50S ribosomal protein L15 [Monoraphidium neglectum]|uniref:50S ribosomal protein L15 n=1 Tax=Monoraphidium neglectum TaxID=145388 RepID=A0A0D2LIZ8_9CHLO|nr:50S ribosomal protein L15 [Monoraphidium neglectum]KIZ06434.1 50S ribosomal protein L15 [Monoraphidium neglectum]|eukprot:XP_013905453.1 50S ribosomal protein L15 [Monoraphidium neglectum]